LGGIFAKKHVEKQKTIMNKFFYLIVAFASICAVRADFDLAVAAVPEPTTVFGGIAIASLAAYRIFRRK
jgi:hypothetical protein